ncbi:flagellin [Thalassococcus sp. BH17M4-6]|uniref:flagellin n=1 Tax=Thalassococcus sp. BH17M4-6 TaxID=3413148 RepID=UPI003BE89D8B
MQSIGDMAQALVLRHRNTQIRQQIDRLGLELSTGIASDPAKHLSGDVTTLATLDRSLSVLEGFRIATTEAGHLTGVMQTTLGHVQDRTEALSLSLLQSDIQVTDTSRAALAEQAGTALDTVLRDLNTTAGGRTLFGGVATDRNAVASSDTLIADLRVALAGQTTLTGIEGALDAWFDTPGGGFETQTYLGSTTSLAPLQLGPSEAATLDIRADDPVFRDTLKALALATLSGDPVLNLPQDLRGDMLASAGDALLQTQPQLTELRAGLGLLEHRIEDTVTRNAAEKASTEMARLNLISVDPYETATQLENAQLQLESLYAVTVRASRLSLTEFLR